MSRINVKEDVSDVTFNRRTFRRLAENRNITLKEISPRELYTPSENMYPYWFIFKRKLENLGEFKRRDESAWIGQRDGLIFIYLCLNGTKHGEREEVEEEVDIGIIGDSQRIIIIDIKSMWGGIKTEIFDEKTRKVAFSVLKNPGKEPGTDGLNYHFGYKSKSSPREKLYDFLDGIVER